MRGQPVGQRADVGFAQTSAESRHAVAALRDLSGDGVSRQPTADALKVRSDAALQFGAVAGDAVLAVQKLGALRGRLAGRRSG